MAIVGSPAYPESAGQRFRDALAAAQARQQVLQVVGTINAYSAIQAQQVGFSAIYLSGSGVASASYGLPDLGLTGAQDVLEDVRRITAASHLPLLVDMDTGWGQANIGRNVKALIGAGAAGAHLEDQIDQKRCGHRPNKMLVSTTDMSDRLKAAADSRIDEQFYLIARTDALNEEGLESAIERASAYVEAGADAVFAEAVTELNQYRAFADALPVPILANITEFGKTPMFTSRELAEAGCGIALYPLSAFRAMSQIALRVYQTILTEGTQRDLLELMQSREDLYQTLDYYSYERQLDLLLKAQDEDNGQP